MNIEQFKNILKRLEPHFTVNDFKGYDPYDGLHFNSRLLNVLKKHALGRLVLIHLNKRSIFNFRSWIGVKKGINPKTISLYIQGKIKQNATYDVDSFLQLFENLNVLDNEKYGWGYYFDWQSRVFFQPGQTPTVVATSFVCQALMDIYEQTENAYALEMVKGALTFYKEDLNVYKDSCGICFSYSPQDKSVIYNASALGLETIVRYQYLSGNEIFGETFIEQGVRFLISEQNDDGSWYYGKKQIQHFIDNYHTAYLLESLENIDVMTKEKYHIVNTIEKGLHFYINNHFTAEYTPKYYHNSLYPIETHCAGAAIKALSVLSKRHGKELFNQALNVAQWLVQNMYDGTEHYFYYQKKKNWTNKINYLRWSQSWIYAGLSFLIAESATNED
jgi:hypothetical protein